MTSNSSLSLLPCQRLADSLARAPSLLSSLPSPLQERLQQSADMVAEREIKSGSSNRQRKPTCGRSKVEQLKSGESSQGRRLYDSCVSALGHLEDQLLDDMEEAGEEVRIQFHLFSVSFDACHTCQNSVKYIRLWKC